MEGSGRAAEYQALEGEFGRAFEVRRDAAVAMASAGDDQQRAAARVTFRAADAEVRAVRGRAATLVGEVTGDEKYRDRTGDTPAPDVNYVFPTFITTRLPVGLVGLMIAAIFAAAMSSIAAELNSLATASVIDIYRRILRPSETDTHYLKVSKLATAFWGVFACVVASFAANLGSLIEVVNRFGSFFYGSLLGVFVLAVAFRRATGTGAFVGLIAGMTVVLTVAFHPATTGISFLWQNPIGAIVVVVVGLIVSTFTMSSRDDR
jgi:Na+/proline symporter